MYFVPCRSLIASSWAPRTSTASSRVLSSRGANVMPRTFSKSIAEGSAASRTLKNARKVAARGSSIRGVDPSTQRLALEKGWQGGPPASKVSSRGLTSNASSISRGARSRMLPGSCTGVAISRQVVLISIVARASRSFSTHPTTLKPDASQAEIEAAGTGVQREDSRLDFCAGRQCPADRFRPVSGIGGTPERLMLVLGLS